MLKPAYANVELNDGTIHTDIRILFADRLAFEKTAKARGWQVDEQPTSAAGFLAWAALKRRNLYAGDYTQFLADVADVQLDDQAAQETDAEGDPTKTGH